MTQKAHNGPESTVQTEQFNADLFMQALYATRPIDERTLPPIPAISR